MEAIIREMKEELAEKEGGDQASGSTKAEEHARVLEAVGEGLLQTHGIAPNSKQAGIFRMLCENANGIILVIRVVRQPDKPPLRHYYKFYTKITEST